MKRKRFLRLLGVGVVLTLLLSVFLPASAVFAAAKLTLDPDNGIVGDTVTVSGTLFAESTPYVDSNNPAVYRYVDLYFTAATTTGVAPTTSMSIDTQVKTYKILETGIKLPLSTASNAGEFSTDFKVPANLKDGTSDLNEVRGGTYYVCAVYNDEVENNGRIRAVAPFTITAGEITKFDPDTGPVGTVVTMSGQNFADSENLTIKFDDSEMDITSSVVKTSSTGKFSNVTFVVPSTTAGEHTITVSDESITDGALLQNSSNLPTFTVESSLAVSPVSAAPGGTAEVNGTGFASKKGVDVTLNGTSVASATTDKYGSFSSSFTVPEMKEGAYKIMADDGTNNFETDFTVEVGTKISVSPETTAAPGYVGQSMTISGVAFKPSAEVTITYTSNPVVVGTTQTDANGAFSFTFKVPKSPSGAHTISASDGTSSLQVPFYMEAKAPPVPQPLLPAIGTKAPSLTKFDWGAVSDDSGVTYTLQVATSQDFAANSVVLEKKGLTTTTYTLTKEESLPSRSAKEPYYWRVMAIDGAGNQGDWTGANDFTVGVSLPPWTVHLFWGLGVIGAVFFGYFLGKRRGYY